MKKNSVLGIREIYILSLLRWFPYLSRADLVDLLFGGTGHSKASYPVKTLNVMVAEGLLRKVWTGIDSWAYAITKKGKQEVELAQQEKFKKPKTFKRSLRFKNNDDLKFQLCPEAVHFSHPKDHTEMCARLLSYYPDLLFCDLLHPEAKKSLKMNSRPDFISLKEAPDFAFEVEASGASKTRKYQKIKSFFPDKDRFKFIVMIFPAEKDIKEYWTKAGWPAFCGGTYTPIGSQVQKYYLETKAITFGHTQFLFAVMPGEVIATKEEQRKKLLDMPVMAGSNFWCLGTERIEKGKFYPLSTFLKVDKVPHNTSPTP